MSNSYSEWAQKAPVKQYKNGSHTLPTPRSTSNTLKSARLTSTARALVLSQEIDNDRRYEEIIHDREVMDIREESRYYVSLRAQAELQSYLAGDLCPVDKKHHERLQGMSMVADREECLLPELVESPEAVAEALVYDELAYLPQQDHNRL